MVASTLVFLTFGDVFIFDDVDYIYLASGAASHTTYAAKILDRETSRLAINYQANLIKQGKCADGNLVLAFVVLETPDLKKRAAHYKEERPNGFGPGIKKTGIKLIDEDVEQLKKRFCFQSL
jgi:hypothetical protein